jgi:DNA primase
VILVEGYMDVVALSQFGVEGVVATLGTSLTQEQARLIKRFAPQVWVAYDGDSAGQHATLRALDIFEAEDIPVRVLAFPDNLDPDEFIRRDGMQAFTSLSPMSAAEYRMERKAEEFDLSTQDGRTEYAKACAEILRRVAQPVELENHLQRLALQTGFTRDVLIAQVGISQMPGKNSVSPQRERLSTKAEPGPDRAEQSLLTLLSTGRLPKGTITAEEFKDPFLKQLCEGLLSGQSPAELMESQADEKSRSLAAEIFSEPAEGDPDMLMRMAEDCLDKLRRQRVEARLAELKQQLPSLSGREKEAALQETVTLVKRLNQLKPGR